MGDETYSARLRAGPRIQSAGARGREVAKQEIDLDRLADCGAWPAPSSEASRPPVSLAVAAPASCMTRCVLLALDH